MHVGDEYSGYSAPFGPMPTPRLQFELPSRALRAIDH